MNLLKLIFLFGVLGATVYVAGFLVSKIEEEICESINEREVIQVA